MKHEIADAFRRGRRFAILSHVDPDGDALGSALGLAEVLRAAGKQAIALVPGSVPRTYDFLPGAGNVLHEPSLPGAPPDALVVVDATSPSRLRDLAPVLDLDVPILNIDHHADNTRFGDLDWVDPTAAASALMIYELACDEGFEISAAAAECLYVGILTDTGRFTFANTDSRALEASAALTRLGARPYEIASHVYARASVASIRMLGRVLATLDMREGGRVACLHATEAMLLETGALAEDSDGFSTYARSIDGVKVGVFLRETQDGNIKVSFRSNEGVEIDGVAGRFGGGGHPRASGARVSGPIEKAKEVVLAAVAEHLRSTAI